MESPIAFVCKSPSLTSFVWLFLPLRSISGRCGEKGLGISN